MAKKFQERHFVCLSKTKEKLAGCFKMLGYGLLRHLPFENGTLNLFFDSTAFVVNGVVPTQLYSCPSWPRIEI